MQNLYTIVAKKESYPSELSNEEISSIIYHDIFDYPLDFSDLVKWKMGKTSKPVNINCIVASKDGYFYREGREGLIFKRLLKRRISDKKIETAKKAISILSLVPSVKMIALTGSLAMKNAGEDSDIDLMIVTKKGALWTSRAIVYLLARLFGIKTRKRGAKQCGDELCLNMWLDESDLIWPAGDRNFYTAHEIAQAIPLVNKSQTYEKFLYKNRWFLDFWPNSIRIGETKTGRRDKKPSIGLVEKILFLLQHQYMRRKISREVVSPTRAIFHPQDWGRVVLDRLNLH